MRGEAQHARHDAAQRDPELRELFERLDVREHPREPDGGEGDGVVEEHLRGVDDPGVLHDLQKSVDGAREHALPGAEHIGVDHEGHEGGNGHRAALRHVDGGEIGERKAQRDAHGGVGDGLAVKSLLVLSAEEEGERHDDGDERQRAQIEGKALGGSDGDAVVSLRVARGVVDAQAGDERDDGGGCNAARDDGGKAERLFGIERGDVHGGDAQNDGGDACDGGPEHDVKDVPVLLHIQKFQREHGHDDGHGKADRQREGGMCVTIQRRGLFVAHKHAHGEQDDDEGDRRIQKDEHQVVFCKGRPHIKGIEKHKTSCLSARSVKKRPQKCGRKIT